MARYQIKCLNRRAGLWAVIDTYALGEEVDLFEGRPDSWRCALAEAELRNDAYAETLIAQARYSLNQE